MQAYHGVGALDKVDALHGQHQSGRAPGAEAHEARRDKETAVDQEVVGQQGTRVGLHHLPRHKSSRV